MHRATSCASCRRGKRKCIPDPAQSSNGLGSQSAACQRCQRLELTCSLTKPPTSNGSSQDLTRRPSLAATSAPLNGVTAAQLETKDPATPHVALRRLSFFSFAVAGIPTVSPPQSTAKPSPRLRPVTLDDIRNCIGAAGIEQISEWSAKALLPTFPLLPTPLQLQHRHTLPSVLQIQSEPAATLLELTQYFAAARHCNTWSNGQDHLYAAIEAGTAVFKAALAEVVLSGVTSWDACLALQVVSIFRMRGIKEFEDIPFALLHSAQWSANRGRGKRKCTSGERNAVPNETSILFDILWITTCSWQASICLGTADGIDLFDADQMPSRDDLNALRSQCLLLCTLLAQDRYITERTESLHMVILRSQPLPVIADAWKRMESPPPANEIGQILFSWKREEVKLLEDERLNVVIQSDIVKLILTEIRSFAAVLSGRVLKSFIDQHQAFTMLDRMAVTGHSTEQTNMFLSCLGFSDGSEIFQRAQDLLLLAAVPEASDVPQTPRKDIPRDLRMPLLFTLGSFFQAAAVLLDLHAPGLKLLYTSIPETTASTVQANAVWQLLTGCLAAENRCRDGPEIAHICRTVAQEFILQVW